MTAVRDQLIATLWQGEDPFRDLPLLPHSSFREIRSAVRTSPSTRASAEQEAS
jgi:hypothetical protein